MNSSQISNAIETKNLILYFQVHQPRRLHNVNFFDLAGSPQYFNDTLNESIVRRIASQCYIPTNALLLELLGKNPQLKIVFSLSGVVIEQLEAYAPEAVEGFRRLARTGQVEFLGETYYHSLSSLVEGEELEEQVLQHAEKLYEVFGARPVVFRNTELIYSDQIGKRISMMGYHGMFTEGHEKILGSRTPHALYSHPDNPDFKIFLRNYRLSDDIAFRFNEGGHPLKVDKFMQWLEAIPASENFVHLAMDYETFGEHHKAGSGIFDFLRGFLQAVNDSPLYRMIFPSEAVHLQQSPEPLSVPAYLSWADNERDLSAWLGNDMQRDAFNSIMKLGPEIKALGNKKLLSYWRYLQTSDHFYYMSVKTDYDGSVHSYFSPFPSSYEAFISYMNVVTHLRYLINTEKAKPSQDGHDPARPEADRQHEKATTPPWVMNLESVPPPNIPEHH